MPARNGRCFRSGGAVVHSGSRVIRHAARGMLAIEHTRGGQHGAGDNLTAIAERKTLVSAFDRDLCHCERCEKLSAEPLRLRHGAACELASADTSRKPEIVLYPGTGTCLAAGSVPVEEQRPQAF